MITKLRSETRKRFAFAIAVPILLGLATFLLSRKNEETMRWVTHTQEVLRVLNGILARANQAESNQRGFLLTDDATFLSRYQTYCALENREIERFAYLTRDNPVQQSNAHQLLSLWTERVHGMNLVLSLPMAVGTNGIESRRSIIVRSRGTMDRIGDVVSRMRAEEERLLRIRLEAQRVASIGLMFAFGLGVALTVLVLLGAYRLVLAYAQARDIAEQEVRSTNRELERRVEMRTAELRASNEQLNRSNQELTQFAYIASHDLQEPLRTIGSYTTLLANRYEGQLDQRADKYIRFIVDGAKRMQLMVQDLLMYSRAGTQHLSFAPVDLNDVVESVKQSLQVTIAEKAATVETEGLPTVEADRGKISMVLQNLISNAIKFRHPDRPPFVHIRSRRVGDDWLTEIRDNGIGFEQQYAERIFVIFQRLHGVGEYPGTGIGLAICKRIIEGHGGCIWAESQLGIGSTFCFRLPVSLGGVPIDTALRNAQYQGQSG